MHDIYLRNCDQVSKLEDLVFLEYRAGAEAYPGGDPGDPRIPLRDRRRPPGPTLCVL